MVDIKEKPDIWSDELTFFQKIFNDVGLERCLNA